MRDRMPDPIESRIPNPASLIPALHRIQFVGAIDSRVARFLTRVGSVASTKARAIRIVIGKNAPDFLDVTVPRQMRNRRDESELCGTGIAQYR
jgi:hypothetical protein